MFSKQGNVTCEITIDSEETSAMQYEAYTRELEYRMEDLAGLQKHFNKPAAGAGRDTRAIRGLHLHYIDEFQTDSDVDGTNWEFGTGLTLTLQEVVS